MRTHRNEIPRDKVTPSFINGMLKIIEYFVIFCLTDRSQFMTYAYSLAVSLFLYWDKVYIEYINNIQHDIQLSFRIDTNYDVQHVCLQKILL